MGTRRPEAGVGECDPSGLSRGVQPGLRDPVREHNLPLGHRGLNLGAGPSAHNALSPGGLKIFQPDLEPSLSAKEERSGWEESKTEKGRPHGLRGRFLCVRYVHVKVSKQETSILVCVVFLFFDVFSIFSLQER